MNGEKLFKSMNNINQEWIEQAKPANKPVIMRTRSKIYRNIAAAAAAVIAISGLTYTGVYAYQKYLVPKSNVNFESHISGDSSVNVYNTGNVTSTEESNVPPPIPVVVPTETLPLLSGVPLFPLHKYIFSHSPNPAPVASNFPVISP